jgi:hypothetical protein
MIEVPGTLWLSGENLDPVFLEKGDREIAGRAAEHVGEDDDAAAALHRANRLHDVGASHLELVLGADRHGSDLVLRADDMLERGPELVGQAAVRDDDEADHACDCS